LEMGIHGSGVQRSLDARGMACKSLNFLLSSRKSAFSEKIPTF